MMTIPIDLGQKKIISKNPPHSMFYQLTAVFIRPDSIMEKEINPKTPYTVNNNNINGSTPYKGVYKTESLFSTIWL